MNHRSFSLSMLPRVAFDPMSYPQSAVETLRSQIIRLENQLADLKVKLVEAETSIPHMGGSLCSDIREKEFAISNLDERGRWPLDTDEYKRYGRQLIMPEIGLKGQLKLKAASILIVGAGGLGCPAATYLAGAGVGTLGLIDGDTVETSNLHRQILHTTDRVGWHKVESAVESLQRLNPKVHYNTYSFHLEQRTALDIIEKYDVILDCTDNPASRYMISDAAVIAGKPLVSASALRTEGQLLVLNNPPSTKGSTDGGFCYRCVFPKAPPAASVKSCGEGGILGPVVGVMGVLMAVESIKIIAVEPVSPVISEAQSSLLPGTLKPTITTPTLLLYSAYSHPPFRSIRLRGRRPECPSCSASSTITRESLKSGSRDYESFCGLVSSSDILSSEERLSAKEYKEKIKDTGTVHTLIDVREKPQYDICHLKNSINIPFSEIISSYSGNGLPRENSAVRQLLEDVTIARPVYFICRHGNDSQLAVRKLKTIPGYAGVVWDIKGGLTAWSKEVDLAFPEY